MRLLTAVVTSWRSTARSQSTGLPRARRGRALRNGGRRSARINNPFSACFNFLPGFA
jgi:hypothetical protein